MRRFLTSLSAAFLVAIYGSSAYAHDTSLDNRADVFMPYNCCYGCFNGFYVGANIGVLGYTAHRTDQDEFLVDTATATYTAFDTSVTGGVLAGYDWQFCNNLLGWVVDWNGTGSEAKTFLLPNSTGEFSIKSSFDWWLSLRARAGLVCDCTLIYITAGAVVADFETRITSVFERFKYDRKRWGFIVGAGAEFAFCQCWSLNGEILYQHFGEKTQNFFSEVQDQRFSFDFKDTAIAARVGINYRFCFGW